MEKPLADILKKGGISYHLYADDTQIYMSFSPTNNNENDVCETLINCVIEIKNWMTAHFLQLNTGKTELNIFGTRQMLLKLSNYNIAGDIDVISYAKNLGVIQNCPARLIFRKRKFDHITPCLIELHWLPVYARITCKVLMLTYKCLNDLPPILSQESTSAEICIYS